VRGSAIEKLLPYRPEGIGIEHSIFGEENKVRPWLNVSSVGRRAGRDGLRSQLSGPGRGRDLEHDRVAGDRALVHGEAEAGLAMPLLLEQVLLDRGLYGGSG
jgi:hypothetical protein